MSELRYSLQTPKLGALSNLAACDLFLDGHCWATVEHYFLSKKAPEMLGEIFGAESPLVAISLTRHTPDPPDSRQILRRGMLAKVLQNAGTRALLLETGDAILVEEHSESSSSLAAELWMEIRAELNKDGPYDELRSPMAPPWVEFPEIPRGSIGWRMGAGESYICDWSAWFGGLTEAGQEAYAAAHPEPPTWRHFYAGQSG